MKISANLQIAFITTSALVSTAMYIASRSIAAPQLITSHSSLPVATSVSAPQPTSNLAQGINTAQPRTRNTAQPRTRSTTQPQTQEFPLEPRVATIRVIASRLGSPSDVDIFGKNYVVVDKKLGRLIRVTPTGGRAVLANLPFSPYGVVVSGSAFYITENNPIGFWRISGRTATSIPTPDYYNKTGRPGRTSTGDIILPLLAEFFFGNNFQIFQYIPPENYEELFFDSGQISQATDVLALSGFYVVTSVDGCLYRATPSNYTRTRIACNLGQPESVAWSGSAYIVSDSFGRLLRVTTSGRVRTILKTGLGSPGGIVMRGSKIIVTDMKGGRLLEVTP